MGQKTNPNIFRLGVNKTWKTEFFEKISTELPLYTFKDLEVKYYIERLLDTQGLILHDYKYHYNNSTLNFYISYFITPEFDIKRKGTNSGNLIVIDKSGNKKTLKKASSSVIKAENHTISNKECTLEKHSVSATTLKLKLRNQVNIKRYLNLRNYDCLVGYRTTSHLQYQSSKICGILEDFFKVLNLFTKNQSDIVLTFCCLNKNLNFLKPTQKKKIMLLRKFRNTNFFKDGIELLFNAVYNKKSAVLLAKFIASQVKKIKRHKFFLAFLKQTLSIFLKSNFSKASGIKVTVKGRLNGAPRAKHKTLIIGDVPIQSIKANIDYAQATCQNSSGSYGVSVWVVEKDLKT
jgi:hypothetical protein